MKICLGGTFNIFHEGHKSLIDKAIETVGNEGYIFIGITTGKIIKNKKNIKSFKERKSNIDNYLIDKNKGITIDIKPIEDKFGPSVEEDFDGIVVSPETKSTAVEINRKRKMIDKKPLKIIEVPFKLADDGKPISSSRIIKKEINKKGEILSRD